MTQNTLLDPSQKKILILDNPTYEKMKENGELLKWQTEMRKILMTDVKETLEQRGAVYGKFKYHAQYAEQLNNVFEQSPNWKTMKPDSKESLRIIANKIGRILNGDPEYDDNWRDIAGYSTLVLNRIVEENGTKTD